MARSTRSLPAWQQGRMKPTARAAAPFSNPINEQSQVTMPDTPPAADGSPDLIARLAQQIPPPLRAQLSAALEAEAEADLQDAPGTARLMALYIRQARSRSMLGAPEIRARAREGLDQIRAALALPPPPAPAAPKLTPGTPLAVTPETLLEADAKISTAIGQKTGSTPASVGEAISLVYQLAAHRTPDDAEIAVWQRNFDNGLAFHEFLLLMYNTDEARARRGTDTIAADLDDGAFTLQLFRLLAGRGCTTQEFHNTRQQLASGHMSRAGLLARFFATALHEDENRTTQMVHDGLSCAVMGTQQVVTLEAWREKAADTQGLARARAALRPATPYTISPDKGMRVSAITSLFRGGAFIEQFMDNITSQTCFDSHCELIIIDADSPENEAETIARYLKDHPSIRYRRMDSCIGIYEAWNMGVQMAQGRYLTNANLDDLRRADSFEIQAGALDTLPFADVVYQDFYYTFDPTLSWEDVAAFGYKSALPLVTPHNMLRFNSPHNAPMWRRSLHDEVGLFDGTMKSAGDYEFWLRCLSRGKSFFKINEPHVVYYQNPKGLSTRADTRGVVEAREAGRRYVADLMPASFVADYDAFLEEVARTAREPATPHPRADRHATVQTALRDLTRRFKTGEM